MSLNVRSRRFAASVLAAAALAAGVALVQRKPAAVSTPPAPVAAAVADRPEPPRLTTQQYIEQFDPQTYERAGMDFFNDRYSPSRLNKPLAEVDITFDFDFAQVDEASERLAGVDRRTALKAIFDKVTAGARNDTERHLAVVRFLQRAAFHSPWTQPMYPDKAMVLDPLVLLELGSMRCGAVARVGADLFDAAGYPVRVVQAIAHTTSEIHYDGSWHLFEADMFGGGQAPMRGGKVLSVSELSRDPAAMDRLSTAIELEVTRAAEHGPRPSTPYPSHWFFSRHGYDDAVKPSWYSRTATPEQAAADKWYGWMIYRTDLDHERVLSNAPARYEPSRPLLESVSIQGGKARLTWKASQDNDGDLLGYRVYVSRSSRGWNHQFFFGAESVKSHWKGGWRPEMYEKLYTEPPRDVALLTTSSTSIDISLPEEGPVYVTVMPYDRYGQSIGRRLFNMTEELELRRPAPAQASKG